MNNPLVSIVILNWNSIKYIHQCVEGVIKQTYSNIEVIFVDNASTDSSLIECKIKYPQFIYVENKTNLGFTGGMNTGISHSKGDYVLLLNTDVYLDSGYVESCVGLMEKNPMVACTAGWEYKWRNFSLTEEKVLGAFGIKLQLRISHTNKDEKDVFGVSGSFPMFRMTVVEDIIGRRGFFFDESFGTGWEDTEVRFFMMYLGYKTILNKNTIAWHVGSASDNEHERMFEKNLNYQHRVFRNRMYVVDRYIKGIFPLWSFYISFFNLIMFVYIFLFQHKSMKSFYNAQKEFKENKDYRRKQKLMVKNNMIIRKKRIMDYIVGL